MRLIAWIAGHESATSRFPGTTTMNVPLTLLVLPLAMLAGCDRPAAENSTSVVTAPRTVKAMKVSHGNTPADARYSGEVRARYEATVGFRVGGKMVERLVDVGARVRAGQPLARLDPADARLAVAQAEANAALADAELKRAQELRSKSFVSEAALDAKVTAARATRAQAQLAANQAAYTTLYADKAGVIAAVLAEPGQVVSAGQAVLRIARDGEREVVIALPESALGRVRPGSPASVSLWANGGSYAGRVREVSPVADGATRTFPVRVSLPGADPGLPLGLTATVQFSVADGDRVVVPTAALFQRGDRPAVWVIGNENAVTLRDVEVERYADEGVVLKGGLKADERIVAAGAFKLIEGEKVRVVE